MLNERPSPDTPFGVIVRALAQRSGNAPPPLLAPAVQAQGVPPLAVLDDAAAVEWSEEDVVLLHWRLLRELAALSDPATPLEEKIDVLRWVFTDSECDQRPFSFVNCLRVVGGSRLSPTPYFGPVDADVIRHWIGYHARAWLDATLARYPPWVRQAFLQHPEWVAHQLANNPQWINEAVRTRAVQRDLFT